MPKNKRKNCGFLKKTFFEKMIPNPFLQSSFIKNVIYPVNQRIREAVLSSKEDKQSASNPVISKRFMCTAANTCCGSTE